MASLETVPAPSPPEPVHISGHVLGIENVSGSMSASASEPPPPEYSSSSNALFANYSPDGKEPEPADIEAGLHLPNQAQDSAAQNASAARNQRRQSRAEEDSGFMWALGTMGVLVILVGFIRLKTAE